MKFLAVPFKEYYAYLVHADKHQTDNDIEITEEQYNYFLDVNNNKNAEIRVVELEDGSFNVKDFYDQKPSDLHTWNRKIQQFEITDQAYQQLKTEENTKFLSSENQRVNIAIAPLDDAIEFGVATEDEVHRHTELRKYRLLLSRVPNQETWPLDPIWPTCPEFFRSKE